MSNYKIMKSWYFVGPCMQQHAVYVTLEGG